jgi:Holliday junction resolvasome RuvABC endonuclease subunit
MNHSKNILAIDPGANSGLAVVRIGPPIKLVAYYHYKFSRKNRTPSEIVQGIVEQLHPRFAIIEDQFHRRNLNMLKILARNSGRWLEACEAAGLEVRWVNPQTWQSKIFRGVGRKREQLEAAYTALAKSETKVLDLPVDVAAAYCLGRYGAIAFR